MVVALAFCSLICQGCGSTEDSARPVDATAADSVHQAASADSARLKHLLEVGDDSETTRRSTVMKFTDVAGAKNADFLRFSDVVPKRYFLPEVMGGGVAWLDYDNDGRQDLYAVNGAVLWDTKSTPPNHSNELFRNAPGGQFVKAAATAGGADTYYGQGCTAGDFNADGFEDLYITNYGRNTLLVNNGDGTFLDATEIYGLGDQSWGTSAVWLDADGDNLLDLYVVNYLDVTRENHQVCTYGGVPGYCGPGHWNGMADLLCLNSGNGQFEVTPMDMTCDPKLAKGLAVAVCDFDGDRQPEVYVGNDMSPNQLLTRDIASSDKTSLYRNVAEAAGCAVSGDGRNEASMGVACADFDGDGRVDIFLTHYFEHKNTLYRNLDSLLFEDNSSRSRAAATSFETLGFGTVAADFDLDGDDDLFISNGHVLGPEHEPNEMTAQLLENDGAGVFADQSADAGRYFSERVIGRGAARGDFNNDGKIDVAVSHVDRPMAILQNESGGEENFIAFHLRAVNRIHPTGGSVTATSPDRRHVVPIVAGGSYLSSNDARIVVGLGSYTGPVHVEVAWPGGQDESFSELASGCYWILREGTGVAIVTP